MKTSIKNNIFYFEILDLKFKLENYNLFSIAKDSLFGNIYKLDFIEMKKNKEKKEIDFDREIFCDLLKYAYCLQNKYSFFRENENNFILFYENTLYDILNDKKYKINTELFDSKGKIINIKTKNNNFIIVEIEQNNIEKKSFFKLNKETKIYEYIGEIKDRTNRDNKWFIMSTTGDFYIIDEDIYKQQKIDDYNIMEKVIFGKTISIILKRNKLQSKLIIFANKKFNIIEANANKIFYLSNLVFYENKKKAKVIFDGKQLNVKENEGVISIHFSNIFENEKYSIFESSFLDKKNIVFLDKSKNEISVLIVKKVILVIEKKLIFVSQNAFYIFEPEKELKKVKINNTNYKIKLLTNNNNKIYLLEEELDKNYLLIYDEIKDQIIKETDPNNLCFIKEKDKYNLEFLDNVTENEMKKNYLLNKYGSEQE